MKLWEGTCAPPFSGLLGMYQDSDFHCAQKCPRMLWSIGDSHTRTTLSARKKRQAFTGLSSNRPAKPCCATTPRTADRPAPRRWPPGPAPMPSLRAQAPARRCTAPRRTPGPSRSCRTRQWPPAPAARHAARAPASHAGPGQQEAPRAQQQRLRQPRDNGQWLREGQLHSTRGGAADGVGPQSAGQETGMGKHRHQHSLWIAGHAPRKPAPPMLRRHRPRVHDLPGHASPAGATPVAMPQSAPAPC